LENGFGGYWTNVRHRLKAKQHQRPDVTFHNQHGRRTREILSLRPDPGFKSLNRDFKGWLERMRRLCSNALSAITLSVGRRRKST